jgi:hypothetical protein
MKPLRALQHSYATAALIGFPILLALVLIGAGDGSRTARFDELTVQRINVVEPDGSLKLVISNSTLQHPGVIGGDTLMPGRQRPPGLLFFDDRGDEMGGLVIVGDSASRFGGLMFDQLDNDETMRLISQQAGRGDEYRHMTGLSVSDRDPMHPIGEVMAMMAEVQGITDPAARRSRIAELTGDVPLMANRLFVGRRMGGEAVIDLRDARGRSRLRMVVESDGAARIEFLDEAGEVVRSLGGE